MRKWIWMYFHIGLMVIATLHGLANRPAQENLVQLPSSLEVVDPVALKYPACPEDYTDWRETIPKIVVVPALEKDLVGFKEALGFKESRGDYFTINTLGYMGKYQFGNSTLGSLGVYDAERFMKNPKMQEEIFVMNLSRNKWILRRYIAAYDQKWVEGHRITESGILAAAHLAGAGNVKKYLSSLGEQDTYDAYGSCISDYIQEFSGYDLEDLPAIHNPRWNKSAIVGQ
ncbi:hypothetical protein [Aureicoccus marinus]|uniref:Peptidoglycan-binding protein LysM n=1 Tax=Aureicoccus marinus TaxID=754435 RepID=A0A2S7T4J7_9FLAO|nr:hypothetical protein [Aureicoccus marinus]PQJ14850.1 hypothetical protein BST99_03060 [Aureicoccus marinus]